MKKIISIASAAVLMGVLALPAFAYNYWSDAVSVTAAYGTPTIDGTVTGSEWDSAAEISVPLNGDPLEAKGYALYQGEWASARKDSDFSDMFKVMWDENNLYILEARKDDVVNLAGTANEPYLTDGTLVFLMPGDDGSSANSVNPDGVHHHIFYTVGNGSGAIGGQMMDRYGDITSGTQAVQDVTGGKIASTKTASGFIVELAFPWSQLGEGLADTFKGPTDNMKLGFSLVIHDSDATDGSTAFVKQICWANMGSDVTPSNGYDYGGWGVLTLSAKPTAAAAAAAATTEAPTAETAAASTDNGAAAAVTTAPTTADFTAVAVFAACVTAAGAFIISRKKK